MGNLADFIEAYLKQRLRHAHDGIIEIQRRQLADEFRCVPSQINYVLATRFSLAKGYLIESRRGGGGYIRISRVNWQAPEDLLRELPIKIGTKIAETEAVHLIERLVELGILPERQASLLKVFLEKGTQSFAPNLQAQVRAVLLKNMLLILLHK